MDRADIAKRAKDLKTKQDLLSLINDIKISTIGKKGFLISMSQLNFHSNPNRMWNRYVLYKIPKKKKGEFRTIHAPNKGLKNLQYWVKIILESIYTPSTSATGFTKGRSIINNAEVHTGKNYVFNIDLKDFFPSIKQSWVWYRLKQAPFNFPQEIANTIAGLCCMKDITEGKDNAKYVLPQGAPTSPFLSNAVCDTLDHKLRGLANRFGVTYSRYADDITFSSNHFVYKENGSFRKELKRIIDSQYFTINADKTRLQTRNARQEVTGLIVNKKTNISKKYWNEIRSILYIWEKYGYAVAYNRFVAHYKANKGHVKKGTPDLENVLEGKLLYLKMVKGEDNPLYIRLNSKFTELLNRKDSNSTSFKDSQIRFIETLSIDEFKKKFETDLTITYDENNRLSVSYIQTYQAKEKKKKKRPSDSEIKTNKDKERKKGEEIKKTKYIKISKSIQKINPEKVVISVCEVNHKNILLMHYPITASTMTNEKDAKSRLEHTLEKLIASNFDLNILLENDTNQTES